MAKAGIPRGLRRSCRGRRDVVGYPLPEPTVLFALVLTVSLAGVVIAASLDLGRAAAPLRVIGLAVIVTVVAVQALSELGASHPAGEAVLVALWSALAMSAFACALLARTALRGEHEVTPTPAEASA